MFNKNNNEDQEFYEVLDVVENGKSIIEKYVDKNCRQVTLIFPEENDVLLEAVLKHLYRLEQSYEFIQVFALFPFPKLNEYTNLPYRVTNVNEKEMDGIVRYAYLMRFSSYSSANMNSLKLISLSVPSSQKADLLVGFKDIDLDKIALRCLLEVIGG